MSQDLYDQTKQLLANRGELSRREIARRTGLSEHWLEKFDQGVIKNPSYFRLKRLNDFFIDQSAKNEAAA